MEKGIWKEGVGENAGMKGLGPCYRTKRGVYTEEGKSILAIKGGKKGSTDICGGPAEERVYLTLQVAPDVASTLRGKKGRHMENGTRQIGRAHV